MSELPILYSFRRCPYAIRARMTLAYAGVVCELREVVLRDKPSSMLSYSAKGTVPVLVLGDRVIDESVDVMKWALRQSDPDGWMRGVREDTQEDAQVDAGELVARCEKEFKPHLDRYKYSDRYPEKSQVSYRADAEMFLAVLQERLVATDWLHGVNMGYADVALMPFIRQFAHVDKSWFDGCVHQRVVQWLTRMLDLPLFTSVMGKYPPWQEGDPPTLFDGRTGYQ